MRPIHVSVIAGLSVATLGICQAEVEGEVHVGLSSEYVWRGVSASDVVGGDAMTEAGVDISATLGGFDVSAGVWHASVHGTAPAANETDFYGAIGKSYGCVDVEVGYIHYTVSDVLGAPDLGELYTSIGTEFMGTDVAFTYFWDIEGDNDGYSELTIDKSFDLATSLTLDLGATISYDWETGDLHHYGVSTAVNWAFNDVLTVSPYLSLTFAEDGAQMGALGMGTQDDEVFGGVIVTAAF